MIAIQAFTSREIRNGPRKAYRIWKGVTLRAVAKETQLQADIAANLDALIEDVTRPQTALAAEPGSAGSADVAENSIIPMGRGAAEAAEPLSALTAIETPMRVNPETASAASAAPQVEETIRLRVKPLSATRPTVDKLRVLVVDADGRDAAVEGEMIPDFKRLLGCSFPALGEVVDCNAPEVYVTLSRTGELLHLETASTVH